MTDKFRRALWASLVLHAVLAFVTLTRAYFGPSEPVQLPDAIRVDIVGLPQKTLAEAALPPEPEPAPAPKTPAAPEPAPTPPPKPPEPKPAPAPPPKAEAPKFNDKKAKPKFEQKDAFAKLRAMDALNKMKAEAEAEAKERAETERRAKIAAAAPPPPIAGHKVTKGNSLTGIERLDYDRYGADLKARVLANWRVPSWLAEAELRARVRVWLDDQGKITKKQIYSSSGNDVFDQATLDAVDASDPFPAPPENLRGVLAAEGFTLGLPK